MDGGVDEGRLTLGVRVSIGRITRGMVWGAALRGRRLVLIRMGHIRRQSTLGEEGKEGEPRGR